MPKFKEYAEKYEIPRKKMKPYRTDIPPEQRGMKNLPRYKGTNKPRVRFQDWLQLKPGDPGKASHGKAANGKWYGWSHRAIYGFKAGDKVEGDSCAKKVDYPKLPDGTPDFDNGKYEPDFTIKNDDHAREVAIRFADSVS